jgi:hypothetical protein
LEKYFTQDLWPFPVDHVKSNYTIECSARPEIVRDAGAGIVEKEAISGAWRAADAVQTPFGRI